MNKKIFTLLASSLMLFMAVFSANAQTRPWVGDTLRYLPGGTGKGAYHLLLTGVGQNPVTHASGNQKLLSLNSKGYLELQDSFYIADDYRKLRESMWCVTVSQERAGQVPTYRFKNKENSVDLAVLDAAFVDTLLSSPISNSPNVNFRIKKQRVFANPAAMDSVQGKILSTGEAVDWWFSRTYNTSWLETNQFLRIELDDEPDYFLTFALDLGSGGSVYDSIYLVKVHANDFLPGADFYQNHLARFTLVSAAARVLSAMDFNTTLYERSKQDWVELTFDPDVTSQQTNVFTQPLWAEDVAAFTGAVPDDHYLFMKTKANNYLYVDQSYHNTTGLRYSVIKDDKGKIANSGEDEFRFVYYPTEDSLIINVREIKNHPDYGNDSDPGAPYSLGTDRLYNWNIWNHLVVRMQDINTAGERVITVYNQPANTRAHFGIHDCETYDLNRTTIEPDLYTIQDVDGRYLVMSLTSGDYTPQWRRLDVDNLDGNDTIEVPFKTPSYQWFVTKVHRDSKTSRIHLTNREFDFIRLEYVQIYNEPTHFVATWNFLTDSLNPSATYVVNDSRFVAKSGFTVVKDDPAAAELRKQLITKHGTNLVGSARHQVEEWMQYMPQNMMQKLYRSGPFLGYKAILPDTLNYFGYAFNYLTKYSRDYYFGVTDKRATNDTLLYVDQERTFFELMLPDTLRAYGREKYGLGHGAGNIYQSYIDANEIEYIAPLERYFYYFKINDYYKYQRNDNFLVLDERNTMYAYTDEARANSRRLNKAKFYMRFTYEKYDTEYYALLDRIDKSNFEYLTKITGWQLTDTLKAHDDTHGTIRQKSFGVIKAYVDEANKYVRATPKTSAMAPIATFAVKQMEDELYRRFNTALEECGRGEDGDEPRTLKFYRYRQPSYFAYEDNHSSTSVPGSGINFMGVENADDCDLAKGQWHNMHNYAIYVDTAYVNRGTGHIKPQYLLVVGAQVNQASNVCNTCGDSVPVRSYVYGRFLRNMTDSARVNGVPGGRILNDDYLYNSTWERLAFVEGFHLGDSLYILNGVPLANLEAKDRDGKPYLNLALVRNYPQIRIIPLDDNLHKDEVFSMRFVERQRDKLGNKIENASKVFLIESETTNRDYTKGRMIAPLQGGWVKYQNGVPVLSRGSFGDIISDGETWEVECASIDELPTSNDEVTAEKVVVVSGDGAVSILNAAGKRAVITNILGQTIANEILTSDNATVKAPKGVIVVSIEGQEAIKTIVK